MKAHKIGKTYNTCLKAEIMKRAHVSLRPNEYIKYQNKLGIPAREYHRDMMGPKIKIKHE